MTGTGGRFNAYESVDQRQFLIRRGRAPLVGRGGDAARKGKGRGQ